MGMREKDDSEGRWKREGEGELFKCVEADYID
jgi:hypothetical protein